MVCHTRGPSSSLCGKVCEKFWVIAVNRLPPRQTIKPTAKPSIHKDTQEEQLNASLAPMDLSIVYCLYGSMHWTVQCSWQTRLAIKDRCLIALSQDGDESSVLAAAAYPKVPQAAFCCHSWKSWTIYTRTGRKHPGSQIQCGLQCLLCVQGKQEGDFAHIFVRLVKKSWLSLQQGKINKSIAHWRIEGWVFSQLVLVFIDNIETWSSYTNCMISMVSISTFEEDSVP